jgi:hypothetical protein
MFENRILRNILRPNTDDVTEEWRMLHTEEFHDIYSSPNIIAAIESRTM